MISAAARLSSRSTFAAIAAVAAALAAPVRATPDREQAIHLDEARSRSSPETKPSVSFAPLSADRPGERIGAANALARIEPDRAGWINAIQQYAYSDGALYQVYAAPGQVTDIALQDGEALVGPGPVAAGDTTRWIIADTVSGSPAARNVHILLKPTRPDIATNLVINTDRRTYHLELRATSATYMAGVSWTYPADQLIALRTAAETLERTRPIAQGIDPAALNFAYAIDGDRPAWRPVRAFDDGRQAYIEFPIGIATGEMPPLFVLGEDSEAELVNYRVQGRFMVVDRLFGKAELRLGGKKGAQRVQIVAGTDQKNRRHRP
ncbi:P-type conjugative transfer protein TrbG [Novosphingobium sp. P6W]|uniref:P-type conjugative transfer protein TrbG n=1 Tax=Novosphingobium sp. P6W TaxID=1609758 RepID=UPI0005C2B178|nr:P-type conjugative transfer protein TrbG [Novosphingobium sp. P6W]AXB76576.1 P-type conjugative transfer protein TrbG [Novosphingobium sp. P6W]KIS30818.1 conjugal transfer protein TrbG [Novosphingobium sp. P6W]